MNYTITAKCENGHFDQAEVDGDMGNIVWAKMYAGMIDGTSPIYLRPPLGSVITKCGICSGKIKCTVMEAQP